MTQLEIDILVCIAFGGGLLIGLLIRRTPVRRRPEPPGTEEP